MTDLTIWEVRLMGVDSLYRLHVFQKQHATEIAKEPALQNLIAKKHAELYSKPLLSGKGRKPSHF